MFVAALALQQLQRLVGSTHESPDVAVRGRHAAVRGRHVAVRGRHGGSLYHIEHRLDITRRPLRLQNQSV